MYAECCLEGDNDETTAKEYIQQVRDRANKNTIALNTTEADKGMAYLQGGTLPTVDEVLNQKPVVGRVTKADGTVICEGMEINSVRRLLNHEYSVELFWEGWRFFNLMRWYNNPNDPDREHVLDNLKNKNALQVEQTGLTGTQTFDYSRHLRVPIPSTELSTNPNMHGNSAN